MTSLSNSLLSMFFLNEGLLKGFQCYGRSKCENWYQYVARLRRNGTEDLILGASCPEACMSSCIRQLHAALLVLQYRTSLTAPITGPASCDRVKGLTRYTLHPNFPDSRVAIR